MYVKIFPYHLSIIRKFNFWDILTHKDLKILTQLFKIFKVSEIY